MRVKVHYVFPDIPETFSGHELQVETDKGEVLTIVRQSDLEPKMYSKEIVETYIDSHTVSALIEWLP
jgi:hypothetical protein